MVRIQKIILIIFLLCAGAVQADSVMSSFNNNESEEKRWNRFADALYALHKKRINIKTLHIKERMGGYFRQKNFYKEQSYYEKKTDKLLSRILWETQNPKNIHVIQVFFYDNKGRPLRDYSASFRIADHDDPATTEISLFDYPQGLRVFRQFNASNEITYEDCEGRWRGKPVNIELDVVDLEEFRDEPNTIMTTPQYRACFGRLPKSAASYIPPK